MTYFFGKTLSDERIQQQPMIDDLLKNLGGRSVVFVGMMGCGKSTVGRRLATRLDMRFFDADREIELAANMSISEIFDLYGEDYFRSGERRVVARLLEENQCVLATGGGAYLAEETRALVRQKAVSVWLRVGIDVLKERVSRKRRGRPLLQTENPQETLERLLKEREPIYRQADICIESSDGPHHAVVGQVLEALYGHLGEGLK